MAQGTNGICRKGDRYLEPWYCDKFLIGLIAAMAFCVMLLVGIAIIESHENNAHRAAGEVEINCHTITTYVMVGKVMVPVTTEDCDWATKTPTN